MANKRCFGLLIVCVAVFLHPAPVPAQTTADSQTTVVYAGATGSIGRIATRMLTDQGFAVRGITRNPDRARERYGDAVDWVYGDVRDPDMLVTLMEGADIVICSIS